ncbi:unnamed protein product [Sphenostylis stenocarpa]|uniref:Uncharacterized protein n=1 Tax=Sphenostylis stenocarpa TaxID=92480 RepID=A0AA86SG34_9FABA|nr:unnamed protein product [Sphenostylis stenocarpa]
MVVLEGGKDSLTNAIRQEPQCLPYSTYIRNRPIPVWRTAREREKQRQTKELGLEVGIGILETWVRVFTPNGKIGDNEKQQQKEGQVARQRWVGVCQSTRRDRAVALWTKLENQRMANEGKGEVHNALVYDALSTVTPHKLCISNCPYRIMDDDSTL